MRRISVDRVDGIRKSGGSVFGEGGTHYEPKPERVETKPDPVTPDDIKDGFAAVGEKIDGITGAVETLAHVAAKTNERLLAIGEELKAKQDATKPKSWGCTVSRDSMGKIKTIDIKENV